MKPGKYLVITPAVFGSKHETVNTLAEAKKKIGKLEFPDYLLYETVGDQIWPIYKNGVAWKLSRHPAIHRTKK